MIDLTKVSELKFDKVIEKIEDINGLVIYEGWKELIKGGVPPLSLYSKGDDLIDYKIYGNSVQGILPSEYQQVEYIESTGSQYIDTGFIPNNNSRFVLKTNMTKYKGWAFGVQDNSLASFDFGFAVSTSADISKSLVCYARTSYIIEESYHSKVITIDLNKNKCYIDDVLINEFEETALISSYPVYLFSGNSYGNANTRSRIKVYSFEIYDNDNLVRNFIPCYRKSDNVIGLYDLVNNTFYTNQGTGTLLKGSNVSIPPTPETPIEVESVGEKTKNLFDCSLITASDFKLSVALSNAYGTSINSNEYTGEIIVTQKNYPDASTPTSYRNGFFSMGLKGLEVGKIYTLMYDFEVLSNPLNDNQQTLIHSSKNHLATINGNKAKCVIEWKDDTYSSIEFRLRGKSVKYTNFMIFEGEVEEYPEYEPYGYKIPVKVSNGTEEIITNIYLNEPLRKISGKPSDNANWVDVFDYLDFKNSKVVRNIRKKDINEFTWKKRTDYAYIFEATDNTVGYWSNPFCNMCDNTKCSPTTGIANMKGDYWIKGNANATIHKIYISDYIDTTVEEFLDTFNGAYIVYALANPTEETIELPNIPTIKGTTIIEVDTTTQPSNMEVIYKGK